VPAEKNAKPIKEWKEKKAYEGKRFFYPDSWQKKRPPPDKKGTGKGSDGLKRGKIKDGLLRSKSPGRERKT